MMFKTLSILLFLIFLVSQPLKASEFSIGFVDFARVLQESTVINEIEAHLKTLNQRFRKYEKEEYSRLNELSVEKQREVRNVVNEKRYNLSLASKINQNKLLAYKDTIRSHVREIAKKHGLSQVFLDENSIILIDGFKDITEEVIEDINGEN